LIFKQKERKEIFNRASKELRGTLDSTLHAVIGTFMPAQLNILIRTQLYLAYTNVAKTHLYAGMCKLTQKAESTQDPLLEGSGA